MQGRMPSLTQDAFFQDSKANSKRAWAWQEPLPSLSYIPECWSKDAGSCCRMRHHTRALLRLRQNLIATNTAMRLRTRDVPGPIRNRIEWGFCSSNVEMF